MALFSREMESTEKLQPSSSDSSYDTIESGNGRLKCSLSCSFVDNLLSKTFYHYGKFVARHKLIFLIGPLILLVVMTTGLLQIYVDDDIESLFTPLGSPSLEDKEYAMQAFPLGNSKEEFLPNRVLYTMLSKLQLIITAKDGGNVFRDSIVREVLELDNFVINYHSSSNSSENGFSDLCMKWNRKCIRNPVVDILRMRAAGINVSVTHPTFKVPHTNHEIIISSQMGDVELFPGTNKVASAKAIILHYYLSEEPIAEADLWEHEIEQLMIQRASSRDSLMTLVSCTSQSLPVEVKKATHSILPRFVATFCMLILFAVLSLMTNDWVVSKPVLGLLGVLSAGFAIVSSVGLLSYCHFYFNEIVSMMPFLVIGVGVDNMFIMVAAWRQLNLYLSVEERMGRTFSEAAVSITITNLTDTLAFVIGATTPLPGVRMFCAYSGVAMVFAYIYQVTFFAACMAYMGEREAKNIHCLTCQNVLPKRESPNSPYKIFCAGGVRKENEKFNLDAYFHHPFMKFFRDYYGPFITKPWVKAVTGILYLAMLSGSVLGCMNLTEGLRLQNLAPDYSPSWQFYTMYDIYHESFSPPLHVIFKGEIDYWNTSTFQAIENTTASFEESDFTFHHGSADSWVRAYHHFLLMRFGSIPPREQYIKILHEEFLTNPMFRHFSLDISFQIENGVVKGINASRIMFNTRGADSPVKEQVFVTELRRIASESSLDVIAFSPVFIFYDQHIGIIPYTFQTLFIAMLSMFMVALIMIPHPACAVWVTICTVSIDTAVLGYMSLWGVSLDVITMINILLCIGFSIDFSAHITYAFVIGISKDPNERIIWALRNLGMPILQGALSSIIAILPLSSATVYIFRAFFKTLFLVMLFGALHGLLFLPVALTILGKIIPSKESKGRNFFQSGIEDAKEPVEKKNSVSSYSFAGTNDTEVVELLVSTV